MKSIYIIISLISQRLNVHKKKVNAQSCGKAQIAEARARQRRNAVDNKFENFTVTVLKLNKLVQKIKLYEMDSYGLKAIHVMCIYYAGGGPVTAGELCKLTYEDKAAISRALSLLKERGFINYDGGKYNAVVTLTEEGVKLYQFIMEKADAAVNAAAGDITYEEHVIFNKVLSSVAKNLESYYNGLIKK